VVESAYPNLNYFNEVDKGGHFARGRSRKLFASEIERVPPLRSTSAIEGRLTGTAVPRPACQEMPYLRLSVSRSVTHPSKEHVATIYLNQTPRDARAVRRRAHRLGPGR